MRANDRERGMTSDGSQRSGSRAPFTQGDVVSCLKVLEAIVADRGMLVHIEEHAERLRLLEAAGRVSLPDRAAQRKLAKSFRRKERASAKAEDEAILNATRIRTWRRAPV